jgi:hypothetical protein
MYEKKSSKEGHASVAVKSPMRLRLVHKAIIGVVIMTLGMILIRLLVPVQ